MTPLKVSAQFAAFFSYKEERGKSVTTAEAMRFARANWAAFLPFAHEGLGKLLIRVARVKSPKATRRRQFAAVE